MLFKPARRCGGLVGSLAVRARELRAGGTVRGDGRCAAGGCRQSAPLVKGV